MVDLEAKKVPQDKSIDMLVLEQVLKERQQSDSAFSPLAGLPEARIVAVKKNDNIRRKINSTLRALQDGEDAFLFAQSSGIQKLLSVLEIVKQKIHSKDNVVLGDQEITLVHDKFVQYNRLDSVTARDQHRKDDTTELAPLGDDEPFTEQHLRELGIVTEKLLTVPILYVYLKLVKTPEAAKDDAFTSRNWTFQS